MIAAPGSSRNAICRSPVLDERAEARPVARRGEPRERREQHRRHGHGEHALRQHVDAEGLVDRGRAEVAIDAGREPGVDEQVEVDQAESERDRQHQDEDALDGLVARVAEPLQVAQAPHRRPRDRELHRGAEQDAEGVRVQARIRRVQERQAQRERAHDHDVPGHGRDGRQEELVERVEDRRLQAVQAEHHDRREDHAREADAERAVVAEEREQLRREHHRDAGDHREPREGEPPDGRGHAPGALALPLRCSRPLKIGTKAAPSAASATSERIRLGIWYATVKALIASPCTVKIHAAAASRSMPDEPARAGRDGEQRGRDRHAAPLGCLVGGGRRACEAG